MKGKEKQELETTLVMRETLAAAVKSIASVGTGWGEGVSDVVLISPGRLSIRAEAMFVGVEVEDMDIDVRVPLRTLAALTSGLTGEEVSIILGEKELFFKCGGTTAGLPLIPKAEKEPPAPAFPEKWSKPPEGLARALALAAESCSRDRTLPVFSCIHVDGDTVTGCDNFRITRCDLPAKLPGGEWLLPAEGAKAASVMELDGVAVTEGWAHFRGNGVVLSCRLGDGEWPDLDPLLNEKGVAKLSIPTKVQQFLPTAGAFSDGDSPMDKAVDLTSDGATIMIMTRGPLGWVKNCMKAALPKFRIQVNPEILSDALSKGLDMILGKRTLTLDGDGFRHVVTLYETGEKR